MLVRAVLRPGSINLQRYTADKGGYPYWHCELYPKDASCETLHRTLLWTIYLNDGFQACSAWIPGCVPGVRKGREVLGYAWNDQTAATLNTPACLRP